jgi:hypothetical protein
VTPSLPQPQTANGAWNRDLNPPVRSGLRRSRSRPMRWVLRLLATAALATVAFAGYLVVEASLRSDAAPVPPPTPTLERPASAPARIPGWAWELHRWQLTKPIARGERPASAPASVPSWYWDWRAWRMSLAPE